MKTKHLYLSKLIELKETHYFKNMKTIKIIFTWLIIIIVATTIGTLTHFHPVNIPIDMVLAMIGLDISNYIIIKNKYKL
jgi:hypothetical protein